MFFNLAAIWWYHSVFSVSFLLLSSQLEPGSIHEQCDWISHRHRQKVQHSEQHRMPSTNVANLFPVNEFLHQPFRHIFLVVYGHQPLGSCRKIIHHGCVDGIWASNWNRNRAPSILQIQTKTIHICEDCMFWWKIGGKIFCWVRTMYLRGSNKIQNRPRLYAFLYYFQRSSTNQISL